MKSVLHTSHVPEEEEPLGRFEQTEILRECISSSLSARAGTSIYVSGLPGTGSLPLLSKVPIDLQGHSMRRAPPVLASAPEK